MFKESEISLQTDINKKYSQQHRVRCKKPNKIWLCERTLCCSLSWNTDCCLLLKDIFSAFPWHQSYLDLAHQVSRSHVWLKTIIPQKSKKKTASARSTPKRSVFGAYTVTVAVGRYSDSLTYSRIPEFWKGFPRIPSVTTNITVFLNAWSCSQGERFHISEKRDIFSLRTEKLYIS
jgi:hypothetical protein